LGVGLPLIIKTMTYDGVSGQRGDFGLLGD
jgi:hypothetical protein